jgi:hypothetical protein
MDSLFETFSDIKDFLANDITTIFIVLAIAAILAGIVYGIPRLVFKLYEQNTIPQAQILVTELIYKLDEMADELSNREKRDKVAQLIHEKAKFNEIAIPLFMAKWIVDFLVKRVREEQAACEKDSDLHK